MIDLKTIAMHIQKDFDDIQKEIDKSIHQKMTKQTKQFLLLNAICNAIIKEIRKYDSKAFFQISSFNDGIVVIKFHIEGEDLHIPIDLSELENTNLKHLLGEILLKLQRSIRSL